MGQHPVPPESEQALGLRSYLSTTPGIGGKLRTEPEDFRVIELGPGPAPLADGAYTAARIELRNWETNRFAMQAARELGIPREHVAFAGMKDKRAVTEQWFTFKAPMAKVQALAMSDVKVLEAHATRKASFTGAHEGNRFVLRVRGSSRDKAAVQGTLDAIVANGGVPNFFGTQRFGGHFRPITHLVGKALVDGDLEEAVRLYVGHPMPGEREEAQAARRIYEETRDPGKALEQFPAQLDPERDMLRRLQKRPGDWRYALCAHPVNLLQLFVHAHQSLLFNEILSARVAAGMGLNQAHVGDRVMGMDEEGTKTHLVTATNRARVQRELDLGRATLTAVLPGLVAPLAEGAMGEIEQEVLDLHGVDLAGFRVREMPEVASEGRRRGILQPVRGLELAWVPADGGEDPVFSFALGKGSYATVVMREFMKADSPDS
ncbi:MAG TPA: tRNA pseudouridine(13) synthase TruD [Candidatus Thermoplasmatota archaeon]|nr:tRNA pseudouridine(13) synthase TruD [Candidatus Thermoplasmatota archaeon]